MMADFYEINIKPIGNKYDYHKSLKRAESLMESKFENEAFDKEESIWKRN